MDKKEQAPAADLANQVADNKESGEAKVITAPLPKEKPTTVGSDDDLPKVESEKPL